MSAQQRNSEEDAYKSSTLTSEGLDDVSPETTDIDAMSDKVFDKIDITQAPHSGEDADTTDIHLSDLGEDELAPKEASALENEDENADASTIGHMGHSGDDEDAE